MNYQFAKGLQDLGNGIYAYLQPDGSWGWSNAGLVVDGDESLLVDTLFDTALTSTMLAAMEDATGQTADSINFLINTHANGDHCHGNHLLTGAEIIASAAAAAEMQELTPAAMAEIMKMAPELGELGEYLLHCFAAFNFEGIPHTPPTSTFSGEKQLRVGDKSVQLIEVGPAHTKGDVLAWVPADKTIFTGDILFIDGTPIMWQGPVKNWLAACDRIMALDVEHIVPGHGPITDQAGVKKVKDYLAFVDQEARSRFDNGMSVEESIADISLGEYGSWSDAERIAVNVGTLYKEYQGDGPKLEAMEALSLMSSKWRQLRGVSPRHSGSEVP